MGSVSKTRIGFTINRRSASTTATTSDVQNESTYIPGNTLARTRTAIAVSTNFKRVFIKEFEI
jgi:hypothetical protein